MPVYRSGLWSAQEDYALRQSVAFYGTHDWAQISHSMSGRTSKQCRERFLNYLRPSLDHSPITPSEGRFIEHMVGKIGTQWSTIAHQLRGRSGNTVKNWWKRTLARRRHIQSSMKNSPIKQACDEHSPGHSGQDMRPRDFPCKIQPTRTINPYATSTLPDRPSEVTEHRVLGSNRSPVCTSSGTGLGRNTEHKSTSDYPSLICSPANDPSAQTPFQLLHRQLTPAYSSEIQAARTNASASTSRVSNTGILSAVHGPVIQQTFTGHQKIGHGHAQLSVHLRKAQDHFYDAMITHLMTADQYAAPTVGAGNRSDAADQVLLPHGSQRAETSTKSHSNTCRPSLVLPSGSSRTHCDPLVGMISAGNSIGL